MLIAIIAHRSVQSGSTSECGWYAVAFVFGELGRRLLLLQLSPLLLPHPVLPLRGVSTTSTRSGPACATWQACRTGPAALGRPAAGHPP